MEKLINILIRTSNRPNGFAALINSIRQQTIDCRLIICVDDNESEQYVKLIMGDMLYILVHQQRQRRDDTKWIKLPKYPVTLYHAPYNEYFNEMLRCVTKGWLLFIDDDDIFRDKNALEIITDAMRTEDDLIMWREQYGKFGTIIPEDKYWQCPPVISHISGSGFTVNCKYKDLCEWDQWSCGDYRIIENLYKKVPNKTYIDQVLTGTQELWGHGNRKDV